MHPLLSVRTHCLQIQHAAKINEIESVEEIRKAEAHMKQYFTSRKKWVGQWAGQVDMTEGGAGGWVSKQSTQ